MKYKGLITAGLTLVLLLFCAAIIAISWSSIAQAREMGMHWGVFSNDRFSAEMIEEKKLTVSGPIKLRLENLLGDIRITTGGEAQVSISAHKTAWGATQAEAEADLASLQVDISQLGNEIIIQVQQPQEIVLAGQNRNDTVDFILTVPVETTITAYTGFGQITLAGVTGQADLRSDYGSITATDIKGGLKAKTASGLITAQNIQAGRAKLEALSDYGDILIERSTAGEVIANSASGLIKLAEIEADQDITLTSGYGEIEFEAGRAARLTVDTSSGQVKLTRLLIADALVAKSGYGDMTVSEVIALTSDLSTDSGQINLAGITNSIKAQSGYGDIRVTNAEKVTLDLNTSSGAINFAGSLAGGPHKLKTDYGDVNLTLPEKIELTLDLKTDYGQIESEVPFLVKGTLEESHWQGGLNGGGATLTASTSSGDIAIHLLEP